MKERRQDFTKVISVFCFCVGILSCKPHSTTAQKFNISVINEIGIEEAATKDEEPYQFSYITSVDCDKEGNLYVLDHKDVCVKVFDKGGKFLRRILSQGKGPDEIVNPYNARINKFKESLFILHEHGHRLKEFDLDGNSISQMALPEQITYDFDFLDDHTLVYIARGRQTDQEYKSIKILDLNSLKITRGFASTKRYSNVNGVQAFNMSKGILWTCPGDSMELVGFDPITGEIVQRYNFNLPYAPYKIIRKEYAPGSAYESARIYNYARPFLFNDQILIFLTRQEFAEDSEELLPPTRRFLKMYHLVDSKLIEAGEFPDFDFFVDIQAFWQNRIIISSSGYDLIPKIVILEVTKN